MAAPNQDAPMQRLHDGFHQLPQLFLDVVRGTLRNETEGVVRRAFIYQYELQHALEHNRMVMLWSHRDPLQRFIVLPLENGGRLPARTIFPETMRDLLVCGEGRLRRLLRAYSQHEEGILVDIRLRFLDFITNGP